MKRARDMWSRNVQPTVTRLKREFLGDKIYSWLSLMGCMAGCLLCSGLAPGAILWIQILGEDAKYTKLCDAATGCERHYSKFVAVFVLGGAVSYLILLPLLVLVDYMGTRLISFIGGVLVVAGNILYFAVLITDVAASSPIAFYTILSLAVLFADTGAHMVMTVMQGFAWQINDGRDIIYIFFTIVHNLSGLLPLLIRFFAGLISNRLPQLQVYGVAALSYLGYLVLPVLGCLLIFGFAVPQEEYIEAAEEVLDIHIPPQKFSLAAFGHIGRALKNTQQVLHYDTSFHRSHIVFIIVMSLNTTWATMYILFASNYGADLFETAGNTQADYQMSVMVMVVVCCVGVVMSIGGNWIVGHYGMVPVVCLMIGAEVSATFVILGKHWLSQFITALAAAIVLALSHVMVGRHMWHYAPPKVLGPTLCLFNCYRIVVSALVCLLSLWSVTELGKGTTFIGLLAVGMGSMVFYFIYIKIKDFPTSVPLIKHEVDDLCCSYGCTELSDVLYIMGMENTPAGVKMLTSAGPELHSQLVASLNPERVEEILKKLSAEGLCQTLERGPAWSFEKDGTHSDGSISNFALTPQLWAQFMQEKIDISLLTRRRSASLKEGKLSEADKAPEDQNSSGCLQSILVEGRDIKGPAAQSELARNIMRAMDARVHTKEFVRILRQQDKRLLDFWLMNKDVSLMCEALWDMIDWDTGLETAYAEEGKEHPRNFDKFKALLPWKHLAETMVRRPDLKKFTIDVLKADLVQAIRWEKARKVAKLQSTE